MLHTQMYTPKIVQQHTELTMVDACLQQAELASALTSEGALLEEVREEDDARIMVGQGGVGLDGVGLDGVGLDGVGLKKGFLVGSPAVRQETPPPPPEAPAEETTPPPRRVSRFKQQRARQ